MIGSVQSTLSNLTASLTSWKGPEDLDKRILTPAGAFVIQGFIRGLESQYGNVKNSLQGLTRDVAGTDFLSPNAALDLSGGRVVNVYNVTIDAPMLTPSIDAGRVIASSLEQYTRLNGANR